MLHFIYTGNYTPNTTLAPGTTQYWMQFLEVAIVAEKYELYSLKDKALEYLQQPLEAGNKIGARKRVQVAIRASQDRGFDQVIGTIITGLCDGDFVRCIRQPAFRKMLRGRPQIRDPLCERHIMQLVKVPEFIKMLDDDAKLAVKCVQAMAQHHDNSHARCSGLPPIEIEDDDSGDEMAAPSDPLKMQEPE